MKKKLLSIALMLMTVASLTACGSAKEESYSTAPAMAIDNVSGASNSFVAEDYGYDDYAEMEESASYESTNMDYDKEVAASSEQSLQNRKLITTMNLTTETEDFEEMISNVENKVVTLGGYVENSNINSNNRSRRNASYTIRVPEANLDAFIESVNTASNVTYKSKNVSDVTLTYVDIQSRKGVYEAEIKSLTGMLEAATDVDTMLSIEMRLADVQAEVESMEAQLRSYDNLCSYSTIYLEIQEVQVYTVVEEPELSAWEKMGQGFMNSLKSVGNGFKNFFMWFVINLPHIIVFAAFVVGGIFGVKAIIKSGKKRKEKKAAAATAAYQNMMFNQNQAPGNTFGSTTGNYSVKSTDNTTEKSNVKESNDKNMK